ncbi:putative acyl-CoA carboxylase alpha chain [Sphingomonas changbaiensis NBRC 104936]|uniref:Putative acyl-CoA carboxylase alpha chain n=1 Tax=Sphingomonas changbaiensis NBRC 104936 TaxID=1219043 RepID=A0A0E9MLN2_9SPHN|nr:acetyl/propionyl/methylcrotonyl-CoA carboxylase subunit alpha [Sphingomonas changbaiensis]GAO38336.1 putative acyl-CoA carboxylase alpha chain [Sphingomonas changbaiensis NBRC 104936]
MIQSLLIANRGEIACRIIRTARRLGIRTVAVYSDADARALHVRQAHEAVHIGPSPARDSYLCGDKIIAAAKATGAEAIHPGYGFLSENADFAQAVIDAGLVWVGPKPHSIRAMGLKDAAKKLMQEAGVPTTPGYLGEDQAPDRLKAEADAIGYPVLIKAVAGGGGKGMRRVDAPGDFADALTSCKREAASSFGDDRVLVEKYILSPRHIEVQVFGDSHGQIVHLFERDCSLQRRHQKVIEEAPAPGMDEATREAVCAAAVKAAKAVDYEGAGTIEFIADASEGLRADRIWFMEMNTRLQVEHPVTEEITGQDLVEWQLRVASGEKLPKRQDELSIDGWAIEARLYAEDPAKGFLPSIGRLKDLCLSSLARVESGVEKGGEVSPFYDPMIAKLVVHAGSRDEAATRLARACDTVVTWPVRNNAGFLSSLLRDRTFLSGKATTGYIGESLDRLLEAAAPMEGVLETAASLLFREAGGSLSAIDSEDFPSKPGQIWNDLLGFRLNRAPHESMVLLADGNLVEGKIGTAPEQNIGAGSIIRGTDDGILIVDRGWPHLFQLPRSSGATAGAAGDGAITSPMPGRIIAVEVAAGASVAKGQKLVTLEAMKMEHTLTAPFDGIVAELNATPGAQVSEGALLVRVNPS